MLRARWGTAVITITDEVAPFILREIDPVELLAPLFGPRVGLRACAPTQLEQRRVEHQLITEWRGCAKIFQRKTFAERDHARFVENTR